MTYRKLWRKSSQSQYMLWRRFNALNDQLLGVESLAQQWQTFLQMKTHISKTNNNIRSLLTLRNPMRHGCGLALSKRSRRSQNSSGSTFALTSSWMSVRTFFSTGFGSRVDNSIKLAKNLRHFSLVLPCAAVVVVVAFAFATAVAAAADATCTLFACECGCAAGIVWICVTCGKCGCCC